MDHIEFNLVARSNEDLHSLRDAVGRIQKSRRAFQSEDASRPPVTSSHRGPGALTADLADQEAARAEPAQAPAHPCPPPEDVVRAEWLGKAHEAAIAASPAPRATDNPFAIRAPVQEGNPGNATGAPALPQPAPPPGIQDAQSPAARGAFTNTLVKIKSPQTTTPPAREHFVMSPTQSTEMPAASRIVAALTLSRDP